MHRGLTGARSGLLLVEMVDQGIVHKLRLAPVGIAKALIRHVHFREVAHVPVQDAGVVTPVARGAGNAAQPPHVFCRQLLGLGRIGAQAPCPGIGPRRDQALDCAMKSPRSSADKAFHQRSEAV